MSCFRLMTRNYLDPNVIASYDFSSEQTAFPLTNIYSKTRRSKVWRSNGYWNITALNNTIIFRETGGGPDLTATIAIGEYTSSSSLAAAIKTAFEATGASTYTVTHNASFKFVIASDGTGGGGILNLYWTNVLSTAASILGYSTSGDDTGSLTYTADTFRINTSEWISWDFGISSFPTAFILAGPRNKPIKITPSATIRLQGNETNVWTSPTYDKVLSYDDEAICDLNADGLSTSGLRFWRLLLDDQNPLGYIEVGIIFLGEHFGGGSGAVQFPLQAEFIDNTQNIFSEGGQTYADIFEKSAAYSVEWRHLMKEDIEEISEFFDEVGVGVPFFISMDSEAVYSTTANRRVKYVKFSGAPQYEYTSPGRFTCRMVFREEL